MKSDGVCVRFESGGDEALDPAAIGPLLAGVAAVAIREDPSPLYVGIVAEIGTIEARRCRTLVEQVTGCEPEPSTFAGVFTIADLRHVLGSRLSPRAARWLVDPLRGAEIRYVICTHGGVRFAAAQIP